MGRLRFGVPAHLELKADDSTKACRGWGLRTCRCGFDFVSWLARLGIEHYCAGVAKNWNHGSKGGLGKEGSLAVLEEAWVTWDETEDDWERGVWRVVGLEEEEAQRASPPLMKEGRSEEGQA